MLNAPSINPVAIEFGWLKIHWYGLTFLAAFLMAWWLGVIRARKPQSGWNAPAVSDLITVGALGTVLGGRLGYVLFYKPLYFLSHPIKILYIWDGGMSFHGGMLGVMAAMFWFAQKNQRSWFDVMDFVAPIVPLGLGAGRLGNFINQELWGRVSDVPWAMVFHTGGPLPRHPAQLYEFFLEGVVLFVLLWWYSARPRPAPAVSSLFIIAYGCFRFFIEFFRQPDDHLGYLAFDWLTMGQVLSLPMIIAGIFLFVWAHRRVNRETF